MKRKAFISAEFIAVFFIILSMSYAGESRELVIVGTGSGVSLLNSVGRVFTQQNPQIIISVPESIGSGGGIRAVGNDEYVLGRIARDINSREKKYGLKQVLFAKIPIVFFVNARVPIWDISPEQACGIYNGTIRRWEDICEGKGRIRVIRRQDGDSSLLVLLRTLPGFNDITLTLRSKTTFTDQATIEECINQKSSIAFGTWADVKDKIHVRALKLAGINPVDHEYPCLSPHYLIYKEKNYDGDLKKFVDFISLDSVKKTIIDSGGLPME